MTSEITELAKALPGWTISVETDAVGHTRCMARDERTTRATVTIRGYWYTDLGEAWSSLVSVLFEHRRFLSEVEISALQTLRERAAGVA